MNGLSTSVSVRWDGDDLCCCDVKAYEHLMAFTRLIRPCMHKLLKGKPSLFGLEKWADFLPGSS